MKKIRMIRPHGHSPRFLPLAVYEHFAGTPALKLRDEGRAVEARERHLRCAGRRAPGS